MSDASAALPYPRALTHVGVTVTDLEQGIQFYQAVFGTRLIHGPITLTAGDDLFGRICRDIFGSRFGEAKLAFLATSNGVAIELFEFIEPKAEQRVDGFEYWKSGFSHLCFIDPEVDRLVDRIVALGGRRRSATWSPWEGPSKKLALCEDPFGNVLEIYSQSTEQMVSNLPHG